MRGCFSCAGSNRVMLDPCANCHIDMCVGCMLKQTTLHEFVCPNCTTIDCKNLPPRLSLDERKEGVICAKGRASRPVEFKNGMIYGKRGIVSGLDSGSGNLRDDWISEKDSDRDGYDYSGTFVSKIIATDGARIKISDTSLLGPHLLILCSNSSMVLFDCVGPLPDLEIQSTGVVMSTHHTTSNCLAIFAKSGAQIRGFHAQQTLHTMIFDQSHVSVSVSESAVVTYGGTGVPEVRRIRLHSEFRKTPKPPG